MHLDDVVLICPSGRLIGLFPSRGVTTDPFRVGFAILLSSKHRQRCVRQSKPKDTKEVLLSTAGMILAIYTTAPSFAQASALQSGHERKQATKIEDTNQARVPRRPGIISPGMSRSGTVPRDVLSAVPCQRRDDQDWIKGGKAWYPKSCRTKINHCFKCC